MCAASLSCSPVPCLPFCSDSLTRSPNHLITHRIASDLAYPSVPILSPDLQTILLHTELPATLRVEEHRGGHFPQVRASSSTHSWRVGFTPQCIFWFSLLCARWEKRWDSWCRLVSLKPSYHKAVLWKLMCAASLSCSPAPCLSFSSDSLPRSPNHLITHRSASDPEGGRASRRPFSTGARIIINACLTGWFHSTVHLLVQSAVREMREALGFLVSPPQRIWAT